MIEDKPLLCVNCGQKCNDNNIVYGNYTVCKKCYEELQKMNEEFQKGRKEAIKRGEDAVK